jgi:hypothetical protein
MIINSAYDTREVEEYDFTFDSGLFMSITVDKEAGDTIEFASSPMATQFKLVSKPSPTDPRGRTTPEELTIFMDHVVAVQSRKRSVTPVSPEQKEDFQKTLIQLSKTIQ